MADFNIENRRVGDGFPPLIIAEIGINHEGSLATAKEMVEAARRGGAELIKHQTHVIDDEMSGVAKRVVPGNAKESIYEIIRRCALDESEERELRDFVVEKGMVFISTPFSRAAAYRLRDMDVPAYKIGSGECNNYPLVELIASFNKPVIMSTGMNSMESIQRSVDILRRHRVPYALMHCTNVYPTPHRLVRLGAMTQLKQRFPDAVVGLSDHTVSNSACLAAIALGASLVERHFTDHMERPGPDIVCSMDERALHELRKASLEIFDCLGGEKGPVPEEQATINFAFATVVSIAPVSKGEVFTKDNIWVKRPGTGEILAKDYDGLLGRRARRDIPADEHLRWSDIE